MQRLDFKISLPVDFLSTSGRYFLNQCKIISIDYSEALAVDGVIGKVDANDIPGENEIIVMWQKEHCDKVKVKSLVSDEVRA